MTHKRAQLCLSSVLNQSLPLKVSLKLNLRPEFSFKPKARRRFKTGAMQCIVK